MFDKLKQGGAQAKKLYELQKQAKALKAELAKVSVTAENTAGSVKITMDGEQKVINVELDDAARADANLALEIKEVTNKAIEKTQKVAAEKMQALAGNMGLPF